MKKLVILFFVVLAGCGGVEPTQNDDPLASGESGEPAHEAPKQPFVFEEVGDYIHGLMPIDIEALPSGNFVVATRDGNVVLQDAYFSTIGHSHIPTNTYWDSGLFSIESYDGGLYAYLTLPESECPSEKFCNAVLRFDIDEESDNPLSNPTEMFLIEMLDRDGQHNGGGMVISPNGKLFLATGDGGFIPGPNNNPQDEQNFLGKIVSIDLEGNETPKIVAFGLRNPFSAAASPDGMFAGDVGLESFEEINFVSFNVGEALNFGWPFEEGPKTGSLYDQPLIALKHCDETYQDQDPFEHTIKSIAGKSHAGVVHACDGTVLTAVGFYQGDGHDPYGNALDGSMIYSEIYYGFVRAFDPIGGSATNDRHITHLPGLASITEGLDGYLYGVSMFASNRVLRLRQDKEE